MKNGPGMMPGHPKNHSSPILLFHHSMFLEDGEITMIISNYEIVEKIDETPHAVVYKAYRKINPARLLVLKVLKGTFPADYKKSQIRQKIEHLRILKDPLVITPLSLGEKDDNCFITQDYFEGVTLDKLMEERSPVSLTDFFSIACQLAGALEKVH
jgi:serine/threonine protein kinase